MMSAFQFILFLFLVIVLDSSLSLEDHVPQIKTRYLGEEQVQTWFPLESDFNHVKTPMSTQPVNSPSFSDWNLNPFSMQINGHRVIIQDDMELDSETDSMSIDNDSMDIDDYDSMEIENTESIHLKTA